MLPRLRRQRHRGRLAAGGDLYKPDPEHKPKQKRLIHLSNFRPVKRVLDCIRIL